MARPCTSSGMGNCRGVHPRRSMVVTEGHPAGGIRLLPSHAVNSGGRPLFKVGKPLKYWHACRGKRNAEHVHMSVFG